MGEKDTRKAGAKAVYLSFARYRNVVVGIFSDHLLCFVLSFLSPFSIREDSVCSFIVACQNR